MKTHTALISIALLLLGCCGSCRHSPHTNRDEALKELRSQVDTVMPAVVSLTGIGETGPLRVDVMTKAELGKLLENTLAIEYPDEALKKRGDFFAALGILPREYDLTGGFLELLRDQAGGVYNQHNKTFIGVLDLPDEQKRAVNDRMIISHELTHALQDRVVDIERQSELGLENIDYEYAVRAVLEGMASCVMVAYAQNLKFDELPDLQSFWRSQVSQAAGGFPGRFPRYLTEYLIGPYAEGGAFIQSWLRANPGRQLADLLVHIPASSEQVLHYEKYAEGDVPANIELLNVAAMVPKEWTPFYANTLGEFDMLMLFRVHKETSANAAEMAAGWDGCRCIACRDDKNRVVVIGTSVWDSEKDAGEFCDGLDKALKGSRNRDEVVVFRRKSRVGFAIGPVDAGVRKRIMESL